MVAPAKMYTTEDFTQFTAQHPDRLFQLIDGEIVEKVPTEEHGAIVSKIIARLVVYIETHNIAGRVVTEGSYRTPQDDYNTRLPDVAYTSPERLMPLVKKGDALQMPDLAIEVKSPTDTYKATKDKAHYYLLNGTKMVWLVYPEKQIVTVLTPDTEDIFTVQDTLAADEIIPGFALEVKTIFNVI